VEPACRPHIPGNRPCGKRAYCDHDHVSSAQLLSYSLLIIGWAAMWEPVTVLLYELWPIIRMKNVYEKISTMEIEILPLPYEVQEYPFITDQGVGRRRMGAALAPSRLPPAKSNRARIPPGSSCSAMGVNRMSHKRSRAAAWSACRASLRRTRQ